MVKVSKSRGGSHLQTSLLGDLSLPTSEGLAPHQGVGRSTLSPTGVQKASRVVQDACLYGWSRTWKSVCVLGCPSRKSQDLREEALVNLHIWMLPLHGALTNNFLQSLSLFCSLVQTKPFCPFSASAASSVFQASYSPSNAQAFTQQKYDF